MLLKTPADFGAVIRDARRKAGLSQAELAGMLKTTQGWVSEVERGKPKAEIGMVLRAIAALGIRLDAQAALSAPSAVSERREDRRHTRIDAVLVRTRGDQK